MSAYSIASRNLPQGTLTPMNTLLFAAGEQGAWYDPSDMSTLFQDSAGTTPVTAVEQPVGSMLDKSGRGNHAIQATTTKRPVLSARYNLLLATAALATQSITTSAASHRLTFSGSGSVTLSGTASGVFGAGTHTIACTAGTLTLTVAGAVNDADFRLATDTNIPYQWVNTATDYDADPNKFPAYLRFDGVDDAMATVGNVDFSGTDKVAVWAGVNVNNLGDTVGHTVVMHKDTGLRAFLLFAPSTAANTIGASFSGSTNHASAVETGLNAPNYSAVLTGLGNLGVTPSTTLRRNALQVALSSVASGGGVFSNAILYIGSQNNGARYFNGRLYGLIVRGGATGLTTVEAVERYMNSKVRAY